MKICYVDESGDSGVLPSATSPVQPALVIAGLILDHGVLPAITEQFIEIKRKRFPSCRRPRYLDSILAEIKGSDVRKDACATSRKRRRHAFGFLDEIMDLLEEHDTKLIGRTWIKGIGKAFDGRAVYTYSVQNMFISLQRHLQSIDDIGLFVADHRSPQLNRNVSHSVFTQKFKAAGDDFDRIIDLPTFAISDNHAGLQLCDLLCSALLFPMSMHAYCLGHVDNLHVRPGYRQIRDRYANRLKALQYRYRDADGLWRGGITVTDGLLASRTGAELFR